MSIFSIILIILVFSVLILIHELGHFWASRRNGVKVEEFGMGYPPRIYGKKFGDTFYSINLIPFGGFVKILGEESENEEDEKKYADNPESFISKTPRQKIAILLAGVFMNLALAVALFYLFFAINGLKSFYIPMMFDYKFKFGEETTFNTVVFGTEKDSPADKAGIAAGETILKIDGEEIKDYVDLKKHLSGKAGQEVSVETMDITDHSYLERKTYKLTPVANVSQQTEGDGDSILGVYLGEAKSISYDKPLEKIFSGPLHAYNMLSYSVDALWKIIKISVVSKDIEPVSNSVTGPVGVFKVLSGVLKDGGDNTFLVLIDTVAIISLGFAFTNVLPIPALDGGRVAFKVYEGVTKRKVNPKFEANVHRIGMISLLFFSVLITFKDLRL